MSKELIRNGGFERGNLDFWYPYTGTSTVQSTIKKLGDYAVDLYSGTGSGKLYVKDFIAVTAHTTYRYAFWYKTDATGEYWADIYFADSDRSWLPTEYFTYHSLSSGVDWTYFKTYFTVPDPASYVYLGFRNNISNKHLYLDGVTLQQIEATNVTAKSIAMIEKVNLSGLTTGYSDEILSGLWTQAEYSLICDSLTGTFPTLDVWIQGRNHTKDEWRDILAFQRLTGAGREHKTVTSGLGFEERVKYTTGGTSVTDCDFKVLAVFKR